MAVAKASDVVARPVDPDAVASRSQRVLAALIGGLFFAVLATGAYLHPDPAGHGTHMQLGMPACSWLVVTGKPCPTCGMTTAVSYAAHGNLWAAFRTQPMGALIALGLAAGVWICGHIALTGSRAGLMCGRLLTPKTLCIVAGIWAASWAYTIATWPK